MAEKPVGSLQDAEALREATFEERSQYLQLNCLLYGLGALVLEHQKSIGKMPSHLRELEGTVSNRPLCDLLLSAFYLMVDDQLTNYRILYRPQDMEWILVALPRHPSPWLPTLAFSRQRLVFLAQFEEGLITKVQSKRPASLKRALSFPGEADLPPAKEGIWGFDALLYLQYAQSSFYHLHGRFAESLQELQEVKEPAKFSLIRDDLGQVGAGLQDKSKFLPESAGYAVKMGKDEKGWWATADPLPGTKGYLYRFRLRESGRIQFAHLDREDWRDTSTLP